MVLRRAVARPWSDHPGQALRTPSGFHRVFSASIEPAFRQLAEETDYDYDPLYSQSSWLAIGITQASRDLIIELPLAVGRWDDIVIRFERDEADRILDNLGLHDEFITFTNEFVSALRIRTGRRDFFGLFMAGIYASGGRYWACPRDELLPAFRHALEQTGHAVLCYPANALTDEHLAAWLDHGLAYLRGIELVESNSNVLIYDYRIKMTPETAEAMLNASKMRDEFIALGEAFLDYLAAISSPFGNRWGAKRGWSADTDPR